MFPKSWLLRKQTAVSLPKRLPFQRTPSCQCLRRNNFIMRVKKPVFRIEQVLQVLNMLSTWLGQIQDSLSWYIWKWTARPRNKSCVQDSLSALKHTLNLSTKPSFLYCTHLFVWYKVCAWKNYSRFCTNTEKRWSYPKELFCTHLQEESKQGMS